MDGLMDEAIEAVLGEPSRAEAGRLVKTASPPRPDAQERVRTHLEVMYKHWRAQPIDNIFRHIFVQWVPLRFAGEDQVDWAGAMLIMGVHLLTGSKQLLDVVIMDSSRSGGFGEMMKSLKERDLIGKTMVLFLPYEKHFKPDPSLSPPHSVALVAHTSLKRLIAAEADPEDVHYLERDVRSLWQAESSKEALTLFAGFGLRWSERYPDIINVLLYHRRSLFLYAQMSTRMTNMVVSLDILAAINPKLARRLDHTGDGSARVMSPAALKGLILLGYYSRPSSWQDHVSGWNSMPEFNRRRHKKNEQD